MQGHWLRRQATRMPAARRRPMPPNSPFRRAQGPQGCEPRKTLDIGSSSNPRSPGDLPARGEPVTVAAEFQAEPVVVNSQIAVAAARHRVRPHRLYFLRHHADIGARAAEIAEAIITEAVVEMAEQHDVVLQRHVGAPAAAAAATAKSAAPAAKATAPSTGETAATTATACKGRSTATATAAEAHLAACRCNVGATSAGGDATQCAVASATAAAADRGSE